jgi:hypothetical protein
MVKYNNNIPKKIPCLKDEEEGVQFARFKIHPILQCVLIGKSHTSG